MLNLRKDLGPRHILIAVFGSRGNVYPLLALGVALRQLGHQVTFATSERYQQEVLQSGLTYRLLRPDPLPKPGQIDEAKGDSATGLRGIVFPRVEETYRDLLSAGKDVDLLIFPMFLFPGPMAAERLGVPWVEAHFTPGTFNSIYDPPFLPPLPWLYPLQRLTSLVPRLFNPIVSFAIRSWHAPLNELRVREGFTPYRHTPLLGGLRSPWLTLAMFSPCLGTQQKDWPSPTVITGFVFHEEADAGLNTAVQQFLDAGDEPIVATLGSVMLENRMKFFEDTIEAARRLGRRLLVIAGPDREALLAQPLPESVLVIDYAPYSLVFPRACVIVLSGSVGPISHGLRAKRPMFIVPAASKADQPDNALRVTGLGAARWLMLGEYSVEAATEHLTELLTDPRYKVNAKRTGEQVLAERGIERACDALEALLAGKEAKKVSAG